MAKKPKTNILKLSFQNFMIIEAIAVFAAAVPNVKGYGSSKNDLFAPLIFDAPGYWLNAFVNFIAFNLIFGLIMLIIWKSQNRHR